MNTFGGVFEPEKEELALEALAMIRKELESLPSEMNNCGLYNGLSGDLLFLYKLSCHDFHDNTVKKFALAIDENLFQQKLEFIQENLEWYLSNYGISRGLSGIGWFLEYVNQQQGEEYDSSFCHEIDKVLLEYLLQEQWLGEIESVLGLGSIAAYAGRRLKMDKSSLLFDRVIYHYEQLAIELDEHTLTWSQPRNSVYRFNTEKPDEPEFNLGLAHGVPGIIAVLIPALALPELHQRVKKLIVNASNWLLQQELNQAELGSVFSVEAGSDEKSRLAWCYGDLTIAVTLLRVGRSLGIQSFINKAQEIAELSSSRSVTDALLVDAGFCHGSAGLAIIFKQLHLDLKNPSCLQASEFWFSHTLERYKEKGNEGFYRFSGRTKEYEKSTSYLGGYGGIGLAILAMLDENFDWTDSLFLS